jgi:hypothetical protein
MTGEWRRAERVGLERSSRDRLGGQIGFIVDEIARSVLNPALRRPCKPVRALITRSFLARLAPLAKPASSRKRARIPLAIAAGRRDLEHC